MNALERVTTLEQERADATTALDQVRTEREQLIAKPGAGAVKKLAELNAECQLAEARVTRVTADLETARQEKRRADYAAAQARYEAAREQCTAAAALDALQALVARALELRRMISDLETARRALAQGFATKRAAAGELAGAVGEQLEPFDFDAFTRIATKLALESSGQAAGVELALSFPRPKREAGRYIDGTHFEADPGELGEAGGLFARMLRDDEVLALFDDGGVREIERVDGERRTARNAAHNRAEEAREREQRLRKLRYELRQLCQGLADNASKYAGTRWRDELHAFAAKRLELPREDLQQALDEVGAWFTDYARDRNTKRRPMTLAAARKIIPMAPAAKAAGLAALPPESDGPEVA
jgi:hypothetical protein